MESRIFKEVFQGSKFIKAESSLYQQKAFETQMSKMGLHDPFEDLKQKLWPKKSQESNWQFDSHPLKVRSFHEIHAFRQHATYFLKALNEGYNFFLNLTSIKGVHKKLWPSKVSRVLISKISRLPTWESQDRMTFGCSPHG